MEDPRVHADNLGHSGVNPANGTMFGFLFAFLSLPGLLLGDLVFRCPRCTADDQDGCPKVTPCLEIVREPGCGCCPVCARVEGEPCGIYTPRCSTGLMCSPSSGAEFPLQQLIQGFGRCTRRTEQDSASVGLQPTNGEAFWRFLPGCRHKVQTKNYSGLAALH